jgi:hypothetical protein
MDVSKMPLGVLASDEGDGVALFVYPMGNGDWYASIAPERDDGGLPMGDHAVRFATSGSQLGDAVLVMALLYRIATDDRDQARCLASAVLGRLTTPRRLAEPTDLNTTYQLPDGTWKITKFYDEPYSGVCVLEAVDPPRAVGMEVPVSWLERLIPQEPDPCRRCGSLDRLSLCDSCGEEL